MEPYLINKQNIADLKAKIKSPLRDLDENAQKFFNRFSKSCKKLLKYCLFS